MGDRALNVIKDRGVWTIPKARASDMDKRPILLSSDFEYDVKLIIDGDFANDSQKQEYLNDIAMRLNLTRDLTGPTKDSGVMKITLALTAFVFYFIGLFFPLINAYLLSRFEIGYPDRDIYMDLTIVFCFITGSLFLSVLRDHIKITTPK